jgi:hypothetical protein
VAVKFIDIEQINIVMVIGVLCIFFAKQMFWNAKTINKSKSGTQNPIDKKK